MPEGPGSTSTEPANNGDSELPELPNPESTSTESETLTVEYEWIGSEEQLEAQISNYDASSTDELCRELLADDALAAENCQVDD